MNSSEKLKIILDLSGLTQEKLARELKVSFPTLNSWVRGRSQPRSKKSVAIDTFYFKLAGSHQEAPSAINAKKQIILDKRKEHKNILKFISSRPDILDQFILSLTYNTNRIEGSTLTEPQTAAILFDGVALPNKSMVEHLEVKNHQAAFLKLLEWLQEKNPITEELILKLHAILMNGILPNAGTYRNHGVRIVGSNVPTANYLKVPHLIKELLLGMDKSLDDVISAVANIHSRFEQIHPFSDGNGRIGRLIIHATLLNSNYPPAVILQKRKRAYISSLNKAQLKGEFRELEEFLCDAILLGFRIVGGR